MSTPTEPAPLVNLDNLSQEELNKLLGITTYNLKDRRKGCRTFVLFGPTGVGKTYQAYLLSLKGRVFYMNLERGETTLEGANIVAYDCRTFARLKFVLGRLKKVYDEQKAIPFDFLFIDSATELTKVLVRGLASEAFDKMQKGDKTGLQSTGNPNKPSLDMYNEAMVETDKTLMWLKDLPVNVIFTAIDTFEKDENGYLFYMPEMSKGVRQSYYQYCDLVGYLGKDDRGFRYLQTDMLKTIKAKCRNPIHLPSPVPPTIYAPDVGDIFRYFGGKYDTEFATAPVDVGAVPTTSNS